LPGDAAGKHVAGDQIVELEVLAPRPQTEAQRAAYETMREVFGSDWRRA
jgi:curved DNA-binding protein